MLFMCVCACANMHFQPQIGHNYNIYYYNQKRTSIGCSHPHYKWCRRVYFQSDLILLVCAILESKNAPTTSDPVPLLL